MEQNAQPATVAAEQTRRDFFKKSSQVAITAPAVALLLTATTKSAKAAPVYGNGTDPQFIIIDDGGADDFTITPDDTP
jgi:hypothetical protein